MRTALQRGLEQQRAVYSWLSKPLLSQLCELHGLTVRDMASIFNCSRSHIAEVIGHKKFPDLALALKLSRYFEVTVEDLWGWMMNDSGERRPLVIETPKGLVRLSTKDKHHTAMALVEDLAMEIYRREGPNGNTSGD